MNTTLRMYLHPGRSRTRLSVEGDLSGAWVRELDRCWHALSGTDSGDAVLLDVSRLDSADQYGYELLTTMRGRGVTISGLDPDSGLLRTRSAPVSWFRRLWDFVTRAHRFHVLSISRSR